MLIRIPLPCSAKKGAPFVHPIDPAPRTAVLAAGFRASRMIRVFPRGWDLRAARFQPQSIAAPVEELRRLARQPLHLEHAVVALTYEGEPGVTSVDRDLFWRAFGVPVFEQYLSQDHQLLAMECDAHSGLHVVRGCEEFRLEREVCACGNRSPRISRAARVEELVELLA